MDDGVFSVFPVVFIGFAFLIALVPLLMMVKIVGRLRWIRRALAGGSRAEGRCVAAFTRTSGTTDGAPRTRRHFVFEFTTVEGRQVRFEDGSMPATTIEGDYVTVAYVPERPEKATVVRDGARAPYAEAAFTLVMLGVFFAMAVGIGLAGFGMFSDAGEFATGW
jgi:hypothetical protein